MPFVGRCLNDRVHSLDLRKQVCALQNTATDYNTLQHTATHCNTLQHTATHCNTLLGIPVSQLVFFYAHIKHVITHTHTHTHSLTHSPTHGTLTHLPLRTHIHTSTPSPCSLSLAPHVLALSFTLFSHAQKLRSQEKRDRKLVFLFDCDFLEKAHYCD